MEKDCPMFTILRQVMRDESGVTAIEYGLIAALVSIVGITALGTVGTNLKAAYEKVSTAVAGAVAP